MKKQSGFSALEIIMAVVIVVLIGAVGWLFYSNVVQKDKPDEQAGSTQTTKSEDQEQPATKKTYESGGLKLSFDYPSDWTVKTNPKNGNEGTGDNSDGDNMIVVSPKGYTLFFDEITPSGLGGVCMPIETSDFKLFGKTKLDLDSYVVGFSHDDTYYLGVSTKNDQESANNDSCHYNGVLQLKESSFESTGASILLFGSYVVGQDQVSKNKPSGTELQQAADILLSVRES